MKNKHLEPQESGGRAARKPPNSDEQGQPDTATLAARGGGNKTTAVIFWPMQGGAPYWTNDLALAKKLWPDTNTELSNSGVESLKAYRDVCF